MGWLHSDSDESPFCGSSGPTEEEQARWARQAEQEESCMAHVRAYEERRFSIAFAARCERDVAENNCPECGVHGRACYVGRDGVSYVYSDSPYTSDHVPAGGKAHYK